MFESKESVSPRDDFCQQVGQNSVNPMHAHNPPCSHFTASVGNRSVDHYKRIMTVCMGGFVIVGTLKPNKNAVLYGSGNERNQLDDIVETR